MIKHNFSPSVSNSSINDNITSSHENSHLDEPESSGGKVQNVISSSIAEFLNESFQLENTDSVKTNELIHSNSAESVDRQSEEHNMTKSDETKDINEAHAASTSVTQQELHKSQSPAKQVSERYTQTDYHPERSKIPTTSIQADSYLVDVIKSLDNSMCRISEYFNKKDDNELLKDISKKLSTVVNSIDKQIETEKGTANIIDNKLSQLVNSSTTKEQKDCEAKEQGIPDKTTHENSHTNKLFEHNILLRLELIEQKLSVIELQKQNNVPQLVPCNHTASTQKNTHESTTSAMKQTCKNLTTPNVVDTSNPIHLQNNTTNQEKPEKQTKLSKASDKSQIKSSNKEKNTSIKNCANKSTVDAPSGNTKRPTTNITRKVRGKQDPLSNLFTGKYKIKVKDSYYIASEQAYQEKKCIEHNRNDLKTKIQNSRDTKEIMRLGCKITTSKQWKEKKKDEMKNILIQKYQYVEEFRTALQETGDALIVEDTGHPFWGVRNGGRNMHGKILMEIRDDPPPLFPTEQVPNEPANNSVYCLVDSNGSGINFNRLLPYNKAKVRKTYTISQAKDAVSDESGPPPGIVLIHTGTNDLIENEDPSPQYLELIQDIQNKWPDCKLIISKLLPRGGVNISKRLKRFNNNIENSLLFMQDIELVDHSDLLFGENPNYRFYVQEEIKGRRKPLLHLNDSGLAILASKFKYCVRKLCNKNTY